jgi:predicted nucleic acid-binding Zn ribbon protein
MPVYVYKNLTTGATFEVEQRITEAALTADPATGDPVKRVIQPVGIAFKGSGFYVTDSRGKNGASKSAGKPDQGKTGSPKGEAPPPPPAATSTQAAASGTD